MLKLLKNAEIKKRLLFTLLVIAIFRLLAHIPVPGVDTNTIRAYLEQSRILGILDLFSGGAFRNFSIVTLGVGPYINASIIIQLLTMMVPSLEELQKEGEYGREKLNMYTKFLTLPLAFVQAYGMYFLLSRQQQVLNFTDFFGIALFIFTLIGGTMLLTWIGDLIAEYGLGNGVSIIIFVGIISRLPTGALRFVYGFSPEQSLSSLFFLILSLLIILGVVLVNEGTRNLPIEYGRRGNRSTKVTNFLPIKINQAGVIPIIFAVSLVSVPSMVSGPLQASGNAFLQQIGDFLLLNFNRNSLLYNLFYFLLVFGFTYFYTSVQFDPEKIADDIKKRGGFIPGIRPGKSTARHISGIVTRLTFWGASFLGLIAILPFLLGNTLGMQGMTLGGTGVLIVVSTVLDTIRQVDSLQVSQDYSSYL